VATQSAAYLRLTVISPSENPDDDALTREELVACRDDNLQSILHELTGFAAVNKICCPAKGAKRSPEEKTT
jgi:hypothetical protein